MGWLASFVTGMGNILTPVRSIASQELNFSSYTFPLYHYIRDRDSDKVRGRDRDRDSDRSKYINRERDKGMEWEIETTNDNNDGSNESNIEEMRVSERLLESMEDLYQKMQSILEEDRSHF